MVALLLPTPVGERLALDDDDALPADELHVTLAYLGEAVDDPDRLFTLLTAVRDGSVEHGPVSGTYNGVCRFTGDPDALVLTFDSPNIGGLRQDVVEALEAAGVEVSHEHGFTAHTTLRYLGPKEDAPLGRVTPVEVSFDRVHLVYGDAAIPVPLSGGQVEQTDSASGGSREYPSTTSPTVNKETKDSAFEQLHPRSGGKFAPKDKPAQGPTEELPADWLDRVLKGDPKFVEPKKGKKGKKGKDKKKEAERVARAADRAKRTQSAAEHAARRKLAAIAGDEAAKVEINRREKFDDGLRAADEAESARGEKAQDDIDAAEKAIEAEKDPEKRAALEDGLKKLEEQDKTAARTFATAKRKLQASERTRRREFEHQRSATASKRRAEDATASEQRAKETAARAKAEASKK